MKDSDIEVALEILGGMHVLSSRRDGMYCSCGEWDQLFIDKDDITAFPTVELHKQHVLESLVPLVNVCMDKAVAEVVHAVEEDLDDADQVMDSLEKPNYIAVWGVRNVLERFGGKPHRFKVNNVYQTVIVGDCPDCEAEYPYFCSPVGQIGTICKVCGYTGPEPAK